MLKRTLSKASIQMKTRESVELPELQPSTVTEPDTTDPKEAEPRLPKIQSRPLTASKQPSKNNRLAEKNGLKYFRVNPNANNFIRFERNADSVESLKRRSLSPETQTQGSRENSVSSAESGYSQQRRYSLLKGEDKEVT